MLEALAACDSLTVASVCANTTVVPAVYREFVAHLQRWAEEQQTHVLVFLDGMQRDPFNAEEAYL